MIEYETLVAISIILYLYGFLLSHLLSYKSFKFKPEQPTTWAITLFFGWWFFVSLGLFLRLFHKKKLL